MIDPISIAGLAISGLSSIYGAVQGNINRRKAEAELDRQKQEMKEWRDREMATEPLQRADAQAALRNVKRQNEEYLESMTTDAVRSGMTDEAKVAMAQKANEAYADTVAQLAAAGQQRKDNIDAQWQARKNEFDKLKISNLMDTSGIQNMVSGLGSAMTSYGQLYANSGKPTTGKTTSAIPEYDIDRSYYPD